MTRVCIVGGWSAYIPGIAFALAHAAERLPGATIVLQDVFFFQQTGFVDGVIIGRLRASGIRPKFVDRFEEMGVTLPPGIFALAH